MDARAPLAPSLAREGGLICECTTQCQLALRVHFAHGRVLIRRHCLLHGHGKTPFYVPLTPFLHGALRTLHYVWDHLRLGRSSHSSWRGRLLSSCWLLAPRSKLSRLVLAAKPAVCMYWTGGAALHALRRGSVWPIAPVRRTGAGGRGLAAALASGLASVKASRPGSLLGGSRRVCNGSKKLFVHGSTVNRRLVEAMHK